MTPDKIFYILAGMGMASIALNWFYAVCVANWTRPDFSTRDHSGTLFVANIMMACILVGLGLAASIAEYPAMVVVGFLCHTSVRFFFDERGKTKLLI